MSLKLGLRNKIRRSRAGGFTGLLDQSFATGATAAYSLRKLKSSATKAVRVREDSGNTETDIGFSGGTLDETALLNHCGSANGFVTKWYDQSGNGNDASNSTASAQPQIVSSGSVIKTDNGNPAIDWSGSTKPFLENSSISTISQPLTLITVREHKSTSASELIDTLNRNVQRFIADVDNGSYRMFANSKFSYKAVDTKLHSHFLIYNGASSEANLDNQLKVTGDAGTNGTDIILIGDTDGDQDILTPEIIFYPDNKSSESADIQKEITNHYSIP